MTACHDKKITKEIQDYAHDMNHFWKICKVILLLRGGY